MHLSKPIELNVRVNFKVCIYKKSLMKSEESQNGMHNMTKQYNLLQIYELTSLKGVGVRGNVLTKTF